MSEKIEVSRGTEKTIMAEGKTRLEAVKNLLEKLKQPKGSD